MNVKSNNKTPNFQKYYHRHSYKFIKHIKSNAVYELVELPKGINFLSDILRIETSFDETNKQSVSICSRLKTSTTWKASIEVAKLIPTDIKGVYYADNLLNDIDNLLIYIFFEENNIITGELETKLNIDAYLGFYADNKEILNISLNSYETN